MDSELEQMASYLPKEPSFNEVWKVLRDTPPNAHVFLDDRGRVSIYPVEGGWLGSHWEKMEADIAPFHG